MRKIRTFVTSRSGATAIEYSLIALLLSLAILGGAGQAGNAIGYLWGNNNSKLQQGLNRY